MNTKLLVSMEEFEASKEYWNNKLLGLDLDSGIHADSAKTTEKISIEEIKFSFSKENCEKILDLCKNQDSLIFVVFLSALNVLLHKYTKKNNIVTSVPIYADDLQFDYNNYIYILYEMDESLSIKEQFGRIKSVLSEAYQHQHYPLKQLLEETGISSFLKSNRVFMGMESLHKKEIIEKNLKENDLLFGFNIVRNENEIDLILNYNKNSFNFPEVPQIILNKLAHVINLLIIDTKKTIKDVCLLTEDERKLVLYDFNNTKRACSLNKSIIELFNEQVQKRPDRLALKFMENELTYIELDKKSNKLANFLKDVCKVGKGDNVGILLDNSDNMIVSILAVLKTGAAYVPVSGQFPVKRISSIFKDSKIRTVLYQNKFSETIYQLMCEVDSFESSVMIDSEQENQIIEFDEDRWSIIKKTKFKYDKNEWSSYSESPLNVKIQSGNLAYIIYTSGTTGNPKGVMITHRAFPNLKFYFEREFLIEPNDRILQFASSTFDASVWEIFMALLTGASLHVIPQEYIRSYTKFESFLNENKISIVVLPPTYLANLDPDNINRLKLLMTGGSAISNELYYKWCDRVDKYMNVYGPTETTICCTCWIPDEISLPSMTVPIGRPLYNTRAFVLDKDLELCPLGAVGELYISTDALALGYMNLPEITKEKFVNNPFEKDSLMYRTGDLVKWLKDGNLEFLGRVDQQVKIRGYRIEISEIESSILSLEYVSQVVVTLIRDNNDDFLCAYIVTDREFSAEEVKHKLMETLPDYMIPAYFIKLYNMPLNINGKIDLKALPNPKEIMNKRVEYTEPENEIEEKLVSIWKSILGLDKIGTCDNFFDVGGNSISLIKMHAQLEQLYPGKIPVTRLFMLSTIKRIGEFIETMEDEETVITLRKIILPSNMLASVIDNYDSSVLNLKIPEDVLKAIGLKAKKLNTSEETVLISLFYYLLSEVIEEECVCVEVQTSDADIVKSMNIDFSEVNSIKDIVALAEKRERDEGIYTYSLSQLSKIVIHKERNEGVLFFARNMQDVFKYDLMKVYDLITGINLSGDSLELRMEYNNQRLKGESVKTLLGNYAKIIYSYAKMD